MQIYKIFRSDEWLTLVRDGKTFGAPIDLADGFIHFSSAETVQETAARHFAGAGDLVLVACDADALGTALKWEVSRGGALFPHLFRALSIDEVLWHRPLPLGEDGAHAFPEALK